MNLPALQSALSILYAALPPAMLVWAVRHRLRRGRLGPLVGFILSTFAAVGIGWALASANGRILDAYVPPIETVRLSYLILAALCLIKTVDLLLLRLFWRLAAIRTTHGRAIRPTHRRAVLALLVQRAFMLAVCLPYVFALLLSYRPKVIHLASPGPTGMSYHTIMLRTADGIGLAGWWIPAARASLQQNGGDRGSRTVLLCHGLSGGKHSFIELADLLSMRGYNVLLFDFRAHGDSEGHFISYGQRERLDVLAAVEWVKTNHADQSRTLFGVGLNTGAVALLAAAVESPAGDALDALVLCEPYADFRELADATAKQFLPRPVASLVSAGATPIMAIHGGSPLWSFSPADLAERVWPRPVLIVHGRGQSFIPFTQTMKLRQRTPYPSEQFWPVDNYERTRQRMRNLSGDARLLSEIIREHLGLLDDVTADPGVRARMLRFFEEAERTPVL